MGSLLTWLSGWMSNPLMLGVGALAVLSPIIIHLLNKRRFKIVDWAAMSFLFDADKKNRRRVKLENFLLLLLRCLAMLLLGLLLAKPFLPSSLAGALGQSQQFQRIILLDDSLSQRTMIGNQTAFDSAKDKVKQLLQMLSTDGNSDFLTIYLTSQPNEPVIANEPVTADSLDAVITRVDELKCSDEGANYSEALAEIADFVENDSTNNNQVVTVLTDMRRRDWQNAEMENSENAPHKLIEKIGKLTPNTFLVDVGSTLEENLAITEIKAEDLLVCGTIIRFSVSVSNFGDTTAEDVALRFRVDDFQPLNELIPTIAPGTTETITFPCIFQYDRDEFSELEVEERLDSNLLNRRVKAEIVQQGGVKDALIEDSEAFYAARALKGIPVLIVDGDPSSVPERSESYYLKNMEGGTGMLIDTATAGEFETISLTKYNVIFLCNIDEASPSRVESLRRWVEDGGGIIFMPGDRVRASTFNKTFYDNGNGVSPMKLEVMEGDISRSSWAELEIMDANHPALAVTTTQGISFEDVPFFSWWRGSVQLDQQGVSVSTPLLMSNEDRTPAMADKIIGNGRSITWAFPADGDWSMWPSHPTYVPVIWDLVKDIVGNNAESSELRVGGKIRELVDLTRYSLTVAKTDPKDEKVEMNARPIGENTDNVLYEVEFDNLDRRGFHQLEFRRDGQESVNRLFAVNVNPDEADLRRIDVPSLPDNYFGEDVKLLSADQITSINTDQANNEIWTFVLIILAAALLLEQFLGWYFGRKR